MQTIDCNLSMVVDFGIIDPRGFDLIWYNSAKGLLDLQAFL
jgi:hypothetical protein